MLMKRCFTALIALTGAALPSASGQGHSALVQLQAHHSQADLEHMEEHAHYRYVGELLFYSSSFLVEEGGVERAATEQEVLGIDLHAHDGLRMVDQRIAVHDPLIDKHIILLSRNEFGSLVLERLSPPDREAFLANKRGILEQPSSKTQ